MDWTVRTYEILIFESLPELSRRNSRRGLARVIGQGRNTKSPIELLLPAGWLFRSTTNDGLIGNFTADTSV